MMSVTSRIKQIRQPRGGFIPPSKMVCIQLNDDKKLSDKENLHSSIIGMVVDYMTRFIMGSTKEEAFKISYLGAQNKAKVRGKKVLDAFNAYINNVNGLDDASLINACKIVTFDVWYRNPFAAVQSKEPEETEADEITIANIKILIERSIKFWGKYGPIEVDGFDFSPNGYTQIVSSGDGDFLSKDTLWDFKVSWYKPKIEHTLQLAMYYIMGKHSNNSIFDSINKIGIFNPRLNSVFIYDMSRMDQDTYTTIERDVIGYNSAVPNKLIDYYVNETLEKKMEYELDYGRWIMHAKSPEEADLICKSVINKNLVNRASHTPPLIKPSKCYFYLCESDMEAQKILIEYLKEKNYLPRTRDGSYKNMFFKVSSLEEYKFYEGYFEQPLNLKQIMDLQTGKWTMYYDTSKKYVTSIKNINKKASHYLGSSRISTKYGIGNIPLHEGDVFKGQLAKQKLKETGRKPQDLANLLEVNVSTVRNWLNEKSRPFAWYAFAVCEYLGLDDKDVIIKNEHSQ